MPQTRITMIFDFSSTPTISQNAAPRQGGWSESLWQNTDQATMLARANRLVDRRAAMLPKGSAVLGYRVGFLDTRAYSQVRFRPGNTSLEADTPQTSMQVRFTAAATNNQAYHLLRAVPDENVENGEYLPVGVYNSALTAYLAQIVTDEWQFKGRNFAAPSAGIVSIDGTTGVVVLDNNVIIPARSYVRILRCRDTLGVRRNGRYYCPLGTTTDTLTLTNWPLAANVAHKGSLRLDSAIYPVIGTAGFQRLANRKVGRPTLTYRGRRRVSR